MVTAPTARGTRPRLSLAPPVGMLVSVVDVFLVVVFREVTETYIVGPFLVVLVAVEPSIVFEVVIVTTELLGVTITMEVMVFSML